MFEDMFIHFDRIHERDRHTNTHTQTDTALRHMSRLHSIARQQNTTVIDCSQLSDTNTCDDEK